jgi:hypothetical protein
MLTSQRGVIFVATAREVTIPHMYDTNLENDSTLEACVTVQSRISKQSSSKLTEIPP